MYIRQSYYCKLEVGRTQNFGVKNKPEFDSKFVLCGTQTNATPKKYLKGEMLFRQITFSRNTYILL